MNAFQKRVFDGWSSSDSSMSGVRTASIVGVSFWSYLKDRLAGVGPIPRLSDLIRRRAAEARAAVAVEAVPA